MGYKLESTKNGALASLLFSIPVALATKGQVNPLKTIGLGVATGAGLGFTGAAYGEATQYLDERARFRDLQNKVLANAGVTEFVNPNNGNIRNLGAGINGLFSEKHSGKSVQVPDTLVSGASGNHVSTLKKAVTGTKNLVNKSLAGEGILPTDTKSPFLNGMDSSLNYTVKGAAYAGITALDKLTQKNPGLYSLTHRAPASFSENEGLQEPLPEDLRQLVYQVCNAQDKKLELERVLLLVPGEYKSAFLAQFEPFENEPPKATLPSSALEILAQPGDFGLGTVASKIGSSIMKGISKAADTVHLSGLATKASGVAERTTKNALEKVSTKATEVADAAVSSGAKNASPLLDKAKQAKESLDTFNAAPKRSDYGTGRTFKNAVKEADKTAFREKAGNSALFDAVSNKLGKKLEVAPDKLNEFKTDIADTVFGAKEGVKNIAKQAGNYQMKREVVKSLTNNQNNNNNQTR